MPEYLAPGVYVQEGPFVGRKIAGVSTCPFCKSSASGLTPVFIAPHSWRRSLGQSAVVYVVQKDKRSIFIDSNICQTRVANRKHVLSWPNGESSIPDFVG